MDLADELTLKIDDGIKTISKVCSFLSIICAVPTQALIFICANRVTRRYATLQILLVMQVNINQLFLNIVLNPIVLFPEICIIRENPLVPLPGSAALHYEIWVVITTLYAQLFFACFFDRHQANITGVQTIGSRWRLSKGSCNFVFVSMYIISICLIALLKYSESSVDAEHSLLQNLEKRWPALPIMQGSCFEPSLFMYFAAATIACLIICVISSAIFSWHTLATLKHASALSYTLKKHNSSLTKALIIQAMSPLSLIMLPILFALVATIVNVGGPIPSSLCFFSMTLHALVHSIILITVTPMYRTKLIQIFKTNNRTLSISDGIQEYFQRSPTSGVLLSSVHSVMNTDSELTLRIDNVIQTIRNVFSILSAIFAVPTLTLIIVCGNRVSKRYSTLLLLVLIQVNANQLYLNLVLDPIMLLPDTCVLRKNPLFRVPGRATLHYEIWVTLIASYGFLFFACFLERHQAVQSFGSYWRLSNRLRNFLFFVIFAWQVVVVALLKASESSSDAENALLQILKHIWPTLPVEQVSCFDYSQFLYFAVASAIGIVIGAIGTSAISWHTMSTIHHALSLSYAIRKFNLSMTRALIFQAISPVFLLMLPVFFSLVAIMVNIGGPIPFSLCYLSMTLHALVYSIILITVTPMYRAKFLQMLRTKNRTFSISDGTIRKMSD